jgi:periplasmic divalent cation tolerance protein
MRLSVIYVPIDSKQAAENIIAALLKEKLIACGNIFNSDSMYVWENELTNTQEYVMLIKTLPSFASKVEQKIIELHSYDIPAVLTLQVNCNETYFDWVEKQLN